MIIFDTKLGRARTKPVIDTALVTTTMVSLTFQTIKLRTSSWTQSENFQTNNGILIWLFRPACALPLVVTGSPPGPAGSILFSIKAFCCNPDWRYEMLFITFAVWWPRSGPVIWWLKWQQTAGARSGVIKRTGRGYLGRKLHQFRSFSALLNTSMFLYWQMSE